MRESFALLDRVYRGIGIISTVIGIAGLKHNLNEHPVTPAEAAYLKAERANDDSHSHDPAVLTGEYIRFSEKYITEASDPIAKSTQATKADCQNLVSRVISVKIMSSERVGIGRCPAKKASPLEISETILNKCDEADKKIGEKLRLTAGHLKACIEAYGAMCDDKESELIRTGAKRENAIKACQ